MTENTGKRARFQAERDRWEAQIGDITTWLIDHWQRYALGYVGPAEFSNLITRYSADARGVWISARPLEDRVRMLQGINGLMPTIFVDAGGALPPKASAATRLRSMLEDIENSAPDDKAKGAPPHPLAAHPKQRPPFQVSRPAEPTGRRRPLHRVPDDKRANDNHLWPVWFGVATTPRIPGIFVTCITLQVSVPGPARTVGEPPGGRGSERGRPLVETG